MAPSKTKPTHALPTRRLAFPKQLELLRGYAIAGAGGAAVQNRQVAKLVGLNFKTTSTANAFFLESGFIERTERGNVPAPEVIALQHAFQWNPDQAPRELLPVVERSWFASTLVPALKVRPHSEDEALGILSREASVGPTYRPELRLLLEYLEATDLIVRDSSGEIRASEQQDRPYSESSPKRETNETSRLPEPPAVQAPSPRGGLPLLIQGLLEQLPKDRRWTQAKADKWLEMASMTFEIVYEYDDDPESSTPPETQKDAEEP